MQKDLWIRSQSPNIGVFLMLFKSATLNTKPQFLKHNTKGCMYQNEINCDYRFTDMFAYFRVSFDNISQMPTNVYLEIVLPAANS